MILVFDVSEEESFTNLKSWIQSLNENVTNAIPKVVIANKIDLDKTVKSYNIKQFQKGNKVDVFECSAKTGINIVEAFNCIIKEVLNAKQKKEASIQIGPETPNKGGCKC